MHWGVGGIVVVALAAYLTAQPWLAAGALESALASKDKEALREIVDFPLLKENLKEELPAYARSHATDKETADFVAGMTSMLAASAMDEAITPSGLIDLGIKSDSAATRSYESMTKFTATYPGSAGKPLTFVLRRQGLHWRVTDIRGVLDVLFAPESQSNAAATTQEDQAVSDAEDPLEDVLASSDTPMLDPLMELEREKISVAAQAAQAMQEKDEADRLAGKSFNESNIGWSFACDQSVHGISMLGRDKLAGLMYDEKSSVCRCVKDEVPYNVEMILASPSRSLAELGEEAINDQVNAFGTCYFRISHIKAQQEQVAAIRRERELQELKEQQDANAVDGSSE